VVWIRKNLVVVEGILAEDFLTLLSVIPSDAEETYEALFRKIN